jgi:hypothetical protein
MSGVDEELCKTTPRDISLKAYLQPRLPVARKNLLNLTTLRSRMDRVISTEALKRWPVIDIAKSRPAMDKGH